MWMPHITAAVVEWQTRGVFPFPSLSVCVGLVPHMYPVKDLRLIVHVASLFHHLACMDTNKFTLWTRHIPMYVQILSSPRLSPLLRMMVGWRSHLYKSLVPPVLCNTGYLTPHTRSVLIYRRACSKLALLCRMSCMPCLLSLLLTSPSSRAAL